LLEIRELFHNGLNFLLQIRDFLFWIRKTLLNTRVLFLYGLVSLLKTRDFTFWIRYALLDAIFITLKIELNKNKALKTQDFKSSCKYFIDNVNGEKTHNIMMLDIFNLNSNFSIRVSIMKIFMDIFSKIKWLYFPFHLNICFCKICWSICLHPSLDLGFSLLYSTKISLFLFFSQQNFY